MRRCLFVLPTLLTVLLVPAAILAEPTIDDLHRAGRFCDRGDEALEYGRVERARTEYGKAIKIAPRFPEAHIGLGNISMHEELFAEALEHYEAARDGFTEFANLLNGYRKARYATAQSQLVDLQDAIALLQSPRGTRSDAIYQISKIENRMARLESVLPPSPSDQAGPPGEIYFLIGNALFRLERLEEAVEQWELCREISPDFAPAANNLAIASMKLGRFDEAKKHLQAAEELEFPVHPQLRQDIENAGPG